MIIEVPGINGLGNTLGCEEAPELICDSLNLNSRRLKLDNSNLEEQEKEIYETAKKYLNSEEKSVFLGGDHSISYPLTKTFLEISKNPAIIVFDAHYDLMAPMKNPTHEEWLRALIDQKNFRNILLVGIRRESENIDKQEIEFARDNQIKIIFSDEFEKRKDEILEFCKNKEIYLSIDLDVLDNSIFSFTGYPEKNGLNEKQILGILERLKNKTQIVDIVEYNPRFDKEKLGLKIIKRILKLII